MAIKIIKELSEIYSLFNELKATLQELSIHQKNYSAVEIHYENSGAVTMKLKKLRPLFGPNNVLSECANRDLVRKC